MIKRLIAKNKLIVGRRLNRLFVEFFESEKSGGAILIGATIISLIITNSQWGHTYQTLWEYNLRSHSIQHWINDGLMTIFFLLVGLELSREFKQGELSDIKNAAIPALGALGGMLVPAAIFMGLNVGLEFQSGAGIPMATDIAFAVGILSLLGSKVPSSLKVFLTALAIIDDLGAILVIAVFYSTSISFFNLGISLLIFGFLIVLNKLKVHTLFPYLIAGFFMWYFMLHSGIHATITGVLLAFVIPSETTKNQKQSPANALQHFLHKPVAFVIVPVFALANTCLVFTDGWQNTLFEPLSTGIISGLFIGKPLGIVLFLLLGVVTGLCALPRDLGWKELIGVGMLGGIGFTMSIFISMLAFTDVEMINQAKMAILIASCISGAIGYFWLRIVLK